jgi:membrane-associated protease RseP (regulator of RpoE activity)
MRLWPARRRWSGLATLPTDDLLITEDLLRRNVEDVMTVRDRQIQGRAIVFRGELQVAPARAVALMLARFKPLGYTPFLRGHDGQVSVQAVPLAEVTGPTRIRVNVLLFLLTCLSTLVAGALFFGTETLARSVAYPSVGWLLSGVPFAGSLLLILGTHEFGHYFAARYHRTAVSLPYFIPAPPPLFFLGTLGAVIRMRSPTSNRNSLFDIAAAGPIAGLVVAIPAILLGLGWSTVGPVPPGTGVTFGDSLMMRLLVYARFGPLPEGSDVFIHPIAVAGWVGLLVTALNLFPVGQLDGGRIAYALFAGRHALIGKATFVGLIALGAITRSLNWFVWAAVLFLLIGFDHSPPLDDVTPLSPRRRALGALCLILLVLLIPPVPIRVN